MKASSILSSCLPSRQFLKFAVVGISSNALIFVLYVSIVHFGGTPKITMTILYVLSVVFSFLANAAWTFEYENNKKSALPRYIVSHMIGYGVNFMLLSIFVDLLHYDHRYIQAVSIVLVALILFLLNKYFVFTSKRV
ncbi:GtrA family protein [Enterovibrio gelatinilyticus]|uniref:GtrA family protein n=1 Tax=Enterovibrio gelatinilyticus TaxID=2899819 RepID=UPI003B66D31B